MITLTENFLAWMVQILLILTRVSAMFILSPVLGRQSVPAMLKIGFSLLVAIIMINFFPPELPYVINNAPALIMAVISELIVGFIIGFITIMFFNLVYVAGHIIDLQIGFSMAQAYDPGTNSQIPISGSILNIAMIMCFLNSGGLTELMRIVAESFNYIPVGGAVFSPALANMALDTFVSTFVLSLNVAMPLLASALLAEIGLGIIVRTAPQMNVFVIGIPLKVIIGLVMLFLMIPMFVAATGPIFDSMFDAIAAVRGGMMPT